MDQNPHETEQAPREAKPKATAISIITTAVVLGVGLSLSRGDFSGIPSWEIPGLVALALLAGGLYFGAVHLLLKGWDRVWASLKARVTGRA